MNWFAADKEGLSRLMKRRGLAWALYEVVQNGLDQNVSRVDVELRTIPGVPQAWLTCEDDDPEGFENLALAWTLFADTGKRSDPTKAGRFTMGEKMVLALAMEAKIATTTGTVIFDPSGRKVTKAKREKGSRIEVRLPMTRAEFDEVARAAMRVIPREGVTLTFNGEQVPHRKPVKTFECDLQTEFTDEEKFLRRTKRKTKVTVFAPLPGEEPSLYELGLPVVPFDGGEPWHVYIHQRVPLNADRDNVTPAYLQTIRVLLANEMRDALKKEHVDQLWLNAATEDDRIDSEAVNTVLDHRFGKKRAIFDPTDPEANKQLMNEGFAIIHGGSLSKGQWANVKGANLATPSGQIRPSGVHYSPDGDPERLVPEDQWTNGMRAIVEMSKDLAEVLIGKTIHVKLVNEPTALPHAAWYGNGVLTFNVGRLGKAWFNEAPPGPKHLELILHELAHDKVKDHLTKEFADEVGRLAVKLLGKLLVESNFLKYHGYQP